jgi:hypothetical protein
MTHGYDHTPSVGRIKRDIMKAAVTMTDDEARFLVDAYYISQEDRKRAHNQVRSMKDEPHEIISWIAEQGETIEGQIKGALEKYVMSRTDIGPWLMSIYGIGPVISAGLMAHIDIRRSPAVGDIYSFAGIAGDGQKPWKKGAKKPFNGSLRTLIWKVGQSFMKFSNRPECTYGHLYRERKVYEVDNNDNMRLTAQAAKALESKNWDKSTDAYKAYIAGKLPPAHLDARARRFAAKIFLSHVHCVMYWLYFGKLPARPYSHAHLGHTHFIMMPNVDMIPGLRDALAKEGYL